MKKCFLYIMIIIGFSACQKSFLTRDNPIATTDAKWWKTDGQLQAALNTIYSGIPAGAYNYSANTHMSFTGMTDDAEWHANFFGEINIVGQGNATPDMPMENLGVVTNADWPIWQTDFILIRDANRFLQYAGNAYDDPALIAQYKLEARALRAWYHLDLFLYYGNIPIDSNIVTPESANRKRAATSDLISFITSELATCAQGLPNYYPANVDRYRITKGACLTMEAWAFLNAHMYSQAAAAAKQVIDLGNYQLYYNPQDSAHSYLDLFHYTGSGSKEAILLGPTNHECYGRLAPASAGGTTNLSPTAAFVDSYETLQGKTPAELGADSLKIYEQSPNFNNNRDPRLASSILYPGATFNNVVMNPFNPDPANRNRLNAVNSTVTGYWVRKYVDLQDIGHPYGSNLDFMVFRYADVLLMYVESLVESGNWQDPGVIKYLNAIRHRAGMPDVNLGEYNSQAKMRELYQRERRVELSFEGSRLFDMRRWGIGKQVMNGPVYGATDPSTGAQVMVVTRHYTDKNDLWPIPVQEITANPNMKQNPGY